MASEFLKYDADDGRSSKLCQNEEDNSYYGELEKEFKLGNASASKIVFVYIFWENNLTFGLHFNLPV